MAQALSIGELEQLRRIISLIGPNDIPSRTVSDSPPASQGSRAGLAAVQELPYDDTFGGSLLSQRPTDPPTSRDTRSISTPAQPLTNTESRVLPGNFSRVISAGNPEISSWIHDQDDAFASQAPAAVTIPSQATSLSPHFQGLRSLGSGITSQINRQRLASSASSAIASGPSYRGRGLPARRGRRGRAVAAPFLPRIAVPNISSCFSLSTNSNNHLIRIMVKVYPPKECPNSDVLYYRFYRDSFNAILEEFDLKYTYDISPNATVASIVEKIVEDMTRCPLLYSFSQRSLFGRGLSNHESLPLRLLGFVNRGRPRPSDGQIRFIRMPISGLTIGGVAGDRNRFAIPSLSIENNCFVIHFIVASYPLCGLLPTQQTPETPVCRHTCISNRIYRRLDFDRLGHRRSESEESCISCGEREIENNDMQVSDDDDDELPLSVTQEMQPSPAPLPTVSSTASAPDSSQYLLPTSLWEQAWTPPDAEDIGTSVIENLADSVFQLATRGHSGPPLKLEICAKDMDGLVDTLIDRLTNAIENKDFSSILSPNREFIVSQTHRSGAESIRSLGDGIEREVFFTALKRFTDKVSQFFIKREGKFASIAVTHSLATARFVSKKRLTDLAILGAITSLCIIHQIPALPFSPLFLHFLVHGCDINSIQQDFLYEWAPSLAQLIRNWIDMGPEGDLAPFQEHFAIFHDIQVASLHDRDEASHKAWAVEMLYKAVIGPYPANHPEIQAFLQGFTLHCKNGFEFPRVAKSFIGGSESFFSLMWASQVNSFDDIESYLHIRQPIRALINHAFSSVPEYNLLEDAISFGKNNFFQDTIKRFLKGQGLPCPTLFEEIKGHFNSVIDLSKVNEPSFRSRMLCWAATGTPTINFHSGSIMMQLVGDDDSSYAVHNTREAMLRAGKISFKTCFKQVRLPASMFAEIAAKSYSPEIEPASFSHAVDHWLLCKILNGIGDHSML